MTATTWSALIIIIALIVVFSAHQLPLPETASASTEFPSIVLSPPILKSADLQGLENVTDGQQVTISTTVSNHLNDSKSQSIVVLFEARGSDGSTRYLTWRSADLEANTSANTEIGVLWTPDLPGTYQLRTFAITNFTRPLILTAVSESKVTIATSRPDNDGRNGNYNQTLIVVNDQVLRADIALTVEQRRLGLSVKQTLTEDEAMLFVFETEGTHTFWMKGMQFPIDIIWLDSDKRVIHIEHSVPPCPTDGECPRYTPQGDSSYVVETVSGYSVKNNIEVGTKMQFVDCRDVDHYLCRQN